MLSIDEAIAHARENYNDIINTTYNKCQYEHLSCEGCAAPTCKEIADENLQLADWLEELKALREEKSEFQFYAKDNYEMGMEIGYKNAIDDAKSVILQTIDNEILVDTLHLRLEQYK